MRTYQNNSCTLEYETIGQGRPFVFIHGLGGDHNQIQSVYDPIDNVQLLVINMQGHGNSEANYDTLDFDYMADDVIKLLQLLNIEKATFGGISMGAAISTNIAIRYPQYVKQLLLIRPAWTHLPMDTPVRTAYLDLAQALQQQDKQLFLQSSGWKIVNETTEYTRNTFLHTFNEPINVKEWQKFAILPTKSPFHSIEELKTINMPTTILACKNDFVHPFEYGEYFHQYIVKSILIEIPSKDVDSKKHREMINQTIQSIFSK